MQDLYEDKIYNFNHKCCTKSGSAGSPILNIKNNKIIGIHRGGFNNNLNNGTFLSYPIKEFIQKFQNKKQYKEKTENNNVIQNKNGTGFFENINKDNICPVCREIYNKNKNKPYVLFCGHTLCSHCIELYKQISQKDRFECFKCCCITQSTNIVNISAYPKEQPKSNYYNNNYPKMNEEFEIIIRNKHEKFSVMVKKSMTIGELKEKILKEHGAYFPKEFELTFKRPLENTKTLEFYGITKTVTLIKIEFIVGG